MKKGILILILGFSLKCFAQKGKSYFKVDSLIIQEIGWYIDTNEILTRQNENIIYVLKLYNETKKREDLSFTMSYILNDVNFEMFNPTYYFTYHKQIIIVKVDSFVDRRLFHNLSLAKISLPEKDTVIKKLASIEDGGWTYSPNGYTFKYTRNRIEKKFYNKADEIPIQQSVWK